MLPRYTSNPSEPSRRGMRGVRALAAGWAAALLVVALGPNAESAWITEPTRSYSVPTVLDDLTDPARTFVLSVTDSGIESLTDVLVGLSLSGVEADAGWAGEIFVSLNKDLGSSTAVLLNRVGLNPGDTELGWHYDGWDLVFDDAVGSGDIHLENLDSGVLSGTWRPDGRLDPLASLRPAMLSVFDGLSGNGDWYLNVADLVGGTVETPAGRMQLSGWTLTLSGYEAAGGAVPESSTSWVVVGLLALGASRVIGGRRNLNPPRGD